MESEKKKKGFFERLFDRLDEKLERKCKCKNCCCKKGEK